MKINFTKKEYRALMEMLMVADWVLAPEDLTTPEDEQGVEEHVALYKRLLSLCKEMGVEDMVEYCPRSKEYVETDAYHAIIHDQFISRYEEHFFWDELIHRLAYRDLLTEIGDEQLKMLDGLERIEKLAPKLKNYENEFDEHGLVNLNVNYSETIKH